VVELIEAGWDAIGRGMLPIERVADGAFLGIAGATRLDWFPGEVEVGWRLLPEHWGHGYATEAGRAWVGWSFARHGVPRVISVCDLPNARSRAVMARLGMRLDRVATVEEDGEPIEVAVHAVTKGEWGGP
jgi:RimJ/RimL family protein N-acetyltransferase